MLELALFAVGMVFFLRLISKMKNFWLFLPHFIRGICGLVLNKKLPKSHDFVRDLELDQETDQELGFDKIQVKIKQNLEKAYFTHVKSLGRLIKGYALLTVISSIFDFFNFLIIMHHFGIKGEEY